jgi:hypothetical protein
MDITKGFWNVPISPESHKYTAFTLQNIGLFEYLVMPMGLKNSPATFARLCEFVFPLQDFQVEGVLAVLFRRSLYLLQGF